MRLPAGSIFALSLGSPAIPTMAFKRTTTEELQLVDLVGKDIIEVRSEFATRKPCCCLKLLLLMHSVHSQNLI